MKTVTLGIFFFNISKRRRKGEEEEEGEGEGEEGEGEGEEKKTTTKAMFWNHGKYDMAMIISKIIYTFVFQSKSFACLRLILLTQNLDSKT